MSFKSDKQRKGFFSKVNDGRVVKRLPKEVLIKRESEIEDKVLSIIRNEGKPKRLNEIIKIYYPDVPLDYTRPEIDKIRRVVGRLVLQGRVYHDELNNMYFFNSSKIINSNW